MGLLTSFYRILIRPMAETCATEPFQPVALLIPEDRRRDTDPARMVSTNSFVFIYLQTYRHKGNTLFRQQ